MRATILTENTAPAGLKGEHGLSILIRHRGRVVLLDAGQSGLFARNAERLGLDLTTVDTAVLSHGHYDHGNGLDTFFRLCPHVPVHARPAALDPQFSGFGGWYIGLKADMLDQYRDSFQLEDGPVDLGDGLTLVPDSVDHEQSLVVDTSEGLVVFNSCSHAGADHIAGGILARFPGKRIAAYVGGLHLMGSIGIHSLGPPPEQVRTLPALLFGQLGVGTLYTGHCTGAPAFTLLRETGGERVQSITTGMTIEIGE